jgi:hypothetical protein
LLYDQLYESTLLYCMFLRDLNDIARQGKNTDEELLWLGISINLMIACTREAYQVLFNIEPEEWECPFFTR